MEKRLKLKHKPTNVRKIALESLVGQINSGAASPDKSFLMGAKKSQIGLKTSFRAEFDFTSCEVRITDLKT